jgi:hypothetical protein
VRADEKLTAFLELETAIHEFAADAMSLQRIAATESVLSFVRMKRRPRLSNSNRRLQGS